MKTLAPALRITEITLAVRITVVTRQPGVRCAEAALSCLSAHIRSTGVAIIALNIGVTTTCAADALALNAKIFPAVDLAIAIFVAFAAKRCCIDAVIGKGAAIYGTAAARQSATGVLETATKYGRCGACKATYGANGGRACVRWRTRTILGTTSFSHCVVGASPRSTKVIRTGIVVIALCIRIAAYGVSQEQTLMTT